jgi:type I restriction enzyme S subunit
MVSPIYTVFKTNEKIDDSFLYKILKTDHYRQIFAASTNASVDRRGSLRWKEFSTIRVPVPSLEEQKEIASIIDDADREVENYQRQLANLQIQKKALMQQLLTGKRRVKVDES